jgi:hypothetical protein
VIDEEAYIRENQDVFIALPRLPNSNQTYFEHEPYRVSGSEDIAGFLIFAIFDAPDDVTAKDVIAFYVAALGDSWSYCVREIPEALVADTYMPPAQQAYFIKGRAIITVTDSFSGVGPQLFDINVDARDASDICSELGLKLESPPA